jgi:hypothetical protein
MFPKSSNQDRMNGPCNGTLGLRGSNYAMDNESSPYITPEPYFVCDISSLFQTRHN